MSSGEITGQAEVIDEVKACRTVQVIKLEEMNEVIVSSNLFSLLTYFPTDSNVSG